MSVEPHTKAEIERDALVRKVPCPKCAAPIGEKCRSRTGVDKRGRRIGAVIFSHTSRYYVAVEAGLVPPLPGVRVG